jgi:hypothetical protein
MKKFFLFATFIAFIVSCNQESKTETASTEDADMKALYEKNLATLKTGIDAIEKGDLDAWAANVADSVVFNSPSFGDTIHTKAHWRDLINFFTTNWSGLELTNAIFLPGIDTASHKPDGSVRYYGTWTGVHSSGIKTDINFYGTFDFNSDNKIVNASEFFDVGGVLNAVTPKK